MGIANKHPQFYLRVLAMVSLAQMCRELAFLFIVNPMVEIRYDVTQTSSRGQGSARLGERVYRTVRANATAKAAKAGLQEEKRRKLERI